MSIYDDVNAQLKDAMKAKDKDRLTALRSIRAAFIEEQKKDNSDTVADDAALTTLRRLAKQRQDSIAAYRDAGREDLAAAEEAELRIIEGFLPALADEATTRAWVQDAITRTGAAGKGDLGKVMGVLMKEHKDVLDGRLAKDLAAQLLGG